MNWIVPILRLSLALAMDPSETIIAPGLASHEGGIGIHHSSLPEQVFTTDITVGAILFGHFAIEGQTIIDTVPPWVQGEGYTFSPYQADFFIRGYLEFGPLQIGAEHLSMHPVMPSAYSYDRKYGSHNTFYLTYEPDFGG